MKTKKSKKKKVVVSAIIILIVVAAAAVAGVYIFNANAQSDTETTYTLADVTTGDLTESITGTGTLTSAGTDSVTAPVDVTIKKYKVEAGESVSKGDVLATISTSAMETTISSLQSDIDSLDTSIAQSISSASTTDKIKANMKGRVKIIYAESGDNVDDVMDKNGALLVLSTDGKMKFSCELTDSSDLNVNDSVNVTVDDEDYDGTVESISSDGKTAVITITDNGPEVGAEATAYLDDTKLGSGKLEINEPVSIISESGTISKVYVDENDKVYSSTSLFYIKNIPLSSDYSDVVTERATKVKQLKQAKALLASGEIVAEEDGIISALTASTGQAVTSGDEILSLYTGGVAELPVSVDELDISSVEVGQSATVSVDAIEDTTYNATVTNISQVGTTSSGVTNYTVTLEVEGDDQLMIGMNATATIIIQEENDVLLLPLEALQSVQGEDYVWLYTGSLPEDSSTDPGTKTVVETGLSDEDYVEITSGLSEGDQVVIVRTKSTSDSSNNTGGMGMMGGMSGGDFSGGGNFSSSGGGGQRPSGGGAPNGG